MENELQLLAKGILRDVPPSTWDTMGFKMFKIAATPFKPKEDDVLNAWKHVIDVEHKAYSSRYRRYAASGGVYANFNPVEGEERAQKTYAADMNAWDEVRLKRIERVDGILKFMTEDNKLFQMNVEDVYSQLKFRQAFTVGTSRTLPAIKAPSYDRFIASFDITVIEDIGTTIGEKIEEALLIQRDRLRTSEAETEKQAIDESQSRGFALYRNRLFFKLSSVHAEVKKTSPNISMGLVASALRDLNAENIKYRKFNLWKYDLPVELPDDDLAYDISTPSQPPLTGDAAAAPLSARPLTGDLLGVDDTGLPF